MPTPRTTLTWRRLPASALLHDEALRRRWDELNAARLDLPFMSADAMTAALDAFGTGRELLLVAEQQGRPAAMLLVVPDGMLRWRTFQPSQLPLGAWVAAPPLMLPDLCRSAMRWPLPACLVMSITQVDPLMAERQDDANDTYHGDYIDTAWIDVEGSFEDYWAGRGKNLRQNLRKQRNRLAADGTPTEMRWLRRPEDMAPAVARYGALESAGWKAGEGTAIHPDNPQGRFYTQLLEAAARRGEALVSEYLIGGRCAAINLALLRRGKLVVLKTTYDESMPKTLSPAFLLREEELQHIFGGSEIRRIEYYGRVMDWHTKLTDQQRTLYHLSAYRWPLLKQQAERRRKAAAERDTDKQAQAAPVEAAEAS